MSTFNSLHIQHSVSYLTYDWLVQVVWCLLGEVEKFVGKNGKLTLTVAKFAGHFVYVL